MIPEDWEAQKLGELCNCFSGGTPNTSMPDYYNGEIPWVTSSDLNKGSIEEAEKYITKKGLQNSSAKIVNKETLLLALYGATAGVCAITKIKTAINQAVLAILPEQVHKFFLYQYLRSQKDRFIKTFTQGGQPNLSGQIVKSFNILIPPLEEQEAIAEALSDADALVDALERLLWKKRRIKEGAMQELLTGRTRLPGFNGAWETKRMGEVHLRIFNRKQCRFEDLPVLTCSKHHGFVDSLSFFKNQVFSRDKTKYKLIKRGELGYPSNHLEEGSIGHQDLYNQALVSPIYVVFSVKENINSLFLHRQFKRKV